MAAYLSTPGVFKLVSRASAQLVFQPYPLLTFANQFPEHTWGP